MGSTGQNFMMTAFLMGAMVILFLFVGYLLAGYEGMIMALVLSGVMNLMAYWQSGSMAIKASGAQPISEAQAPELHRMIENLSQKAGIPKPDVYVVPTNMPNAFATGRNPSDGKVAVTEGITRLLTEEELAGVVAHELAHIDNYDILTSAVAGVMAGAITYLGQMARYSMMTAAAYGGSSYGSNRRRQASGGSIIALLALMLAPIAATMIRFAISRQREFAADARGAKILGNPLPLANALAKMASLPPQAMASEHAPPSIAHMYFFPPFLGGLDSLFKTHPSTEERIARLHAMAREMGITQ